MADFSAKDVQALRKATDVGMMEAKKALTENGGDFDAAAQWLRERGLSKASAREDRDNSQGTVALAVSGASAALVELKSETDFAAKADDFVSLVNELAGMVAAEGEGAVEQKATAIEDLKLSKKENIELGSVIRFEAADGNLVDTYLHSQDGRGTNAVIVEGSGVDQELLHEIALHIAFAKPVALTRDEVSSEAIEKEREAALGVTKAEGKPEQAWEKIVEGRVNKWLSEKVLLEQGMFGDKETVAQKIGDGSIVRFAQVAIGG
ncbi:MAG: translation elongation factor Ts [Actinomycetia bacterium]|nr:translation elongation factor Ts [Actinomycetes bacterium]MCP3909357.1 translation elongation factor Ts [Actinomycetes bacterium]MCP4087616.1 translation elongation factor Ts [Actinomycetes bacterium]